MIYQHIRGLRPISLEAARIYAKGFNCRLEDISLRIAEQIKNALDTSYLAESPRADYITDFASIPLLESSPEQLSETGYTAIRSLGISRIWIEKNLHSLSDIYNLVFTHYDESFMSPTLSPGDILLVDTGITSISTEGLYLLQTGSGLRVKRIRQRTDNTFEISDDSHEIEIAEILENPVKGRLLWVWSGKAL